ncbi:MAG: efflux RND transporter periplasmic adaptor subunit, partial [Alphaproteobacteria bacterium]|nr:efflux RND transporter periplasmic adaptor subunit [Alphaproteobacteria bacterium]
MDFDPDNHDTQPVVESKRRRRLFSPVFTAIIVFLALVGWLGSGVLFNTEKVEAAKSIMETDNISRNFKVVVREVRVESYPNTVILQARSEADKIVTIASETGGTISKLPVLKGAFVQKGQIICRIDVGARGANLAQARAQRDARKIEFNAAEKLVKQGHMSKSQMAGAQAAYDASVAAVKAALVELERTKIRAPFDGILDRQPVKIGHFMSPGQPCGTVIDKDPLLVVGYVAESQINRVSVGADGSAKFSTGEVAQGKIRYIAESPNLTTRTFRVELEVANKDLLLRDGLTAELIINAGEVLASRVPQSVLT